MSHAPATIATELSNVIEDLRAELRERTAEHGTIYYFHFTEDQVEDMAYGLVPMSVKAMCRACLDWADEDRRRAQRPVKAPVRKRRRGSAKQADAVDPIDGRVTE